MTNREYLKARVIRIYRFGSPFVLVILASAIYGRKSGLLGLLILMAVAAYLAVYIVLMRRTPCLRCSAPLGNAALNWGSKRQPAPRCPNCGVGIDDRMSG
jgi:DNA-directed RNA polymerase subunit RPC12/RpoP